MVFFIKTADKAVQQRLGLNCKILWKRSARACFLQAVGNRIKLCAGSLHANAGFKMPDEIASSLVRPHGDPKARAKGVESCGHDADESPGSAAQDKTLAKNLWIAAEFSLPKPVIHYKYGRRVGAAIFLGERSTQQRVHAQIVKRVRRYARASRQNASGLAIVVEESARESMSNHVFEDMILFVKSAEFRG